MPRVRKNNDAAANVGFEAHLLAPADAVRENMDAAEYTGDACGILGGVSPARLGFGGTFVGSEEFAEKRLGHIGQTGILGQEPYYTTWRLAKMNLAIRGIDARIGHGHCFHNDRHPDRRADFVLANLPFDDSDWRYELQGPAEEEAPGGPLVPMGQLRVWAMPIIEERDRLLGERERLQRENSSLQREIGRLEGILEARGKGEGAPRPWWRRIFRRDPRGG